MASDIMSMLIPSVVTKIISTVRTPGNVLSRRFGFQIGGQNVFKFNGRTYTYDIFNNVRQVARGRLQGAPSGSTSMNPVGNVQITLARSAEKVQLDYNTLNQIRAIGKNAGSRDIMGMKYIEKQSKYVVQRQNNFREFMVAGALFNGGSYSFYRSGDDLIPSFDTAATGAPYFIVSHQVPATNLLLGSVFAPGLTMGGAGNIINEPWSNPNSDIPRMCDAVSDRFMALVGQPLKTIYIDNITKNYILQNDRVRALAGSSNTPFSRYENTGTKNPDGSDAGLYVFVLTGMPNYEFFVYAGVLEVAVGSPTNLVQTKLLPDGYATFMIDFDPSWLQMVEGMEIIKDNDLAPGVERIGHYAWMMEKADPARFEIHNVQNAGLELNIPSAIATARVR